MNACLIGNKYMLKGCFRTRLSWWLLLAALAIIPVSSRAITHYVCQESPSPTSPYTNWHTASHTIYSALTITEPGDVVLVTNGLYFWAPYIGGEPGAYAAGMWNRLVVSNEVMVKSVNGPVATVLFGGVEIYRPPIRCAYLGPGAGLSGFTLTDGSSGTNFNESAWGGGVYAESHSAIISNCIITGNDARYYGGGVFGGTLHNCLIVSNSANLQGGGVVSSVLYNCIIRENYAHGSGGGALSCMLKDCLLEKNSGMQGGGVYMSILERCVVVDNKSEYSGAGALECDLTGCLLVGNCAGMSGGGASAGRLLNCILVNNLADCCGGGASWCTLQNCVIWSNSACYNDNLYTSTVSYSSSPDVVHGVNGNITNDPMFVDWATSNFHFQAGSPCIDAGSDDAPYCMTDIDNLPRPLDGDNDGIAHCDMGVYEYMHPLADSDSDWLVDTNEMAMGTNPTLADTDGDELTDSAELKVQTDPLQVDTDHDKMSDGAEIKAGTDPLDQDSFLGMLSSEAGREIVIQWSSVAGKSYNLIRRSTPGTDTREVVFSNIPAFPPVNTATVTTSQTSSSAFYWVELVY